MFNWFRPKCPVEPDVKAWVERRMSWLVEQFGWERLVHGNVILPDEEHFPDPYDGSEAHARALLDRVCRYMDIDPEGVTMRLYSELRQVAMNMPVVRPDGGTAGLYSRKAGQTMIWLETSRLADPTSVVATFAHELCHAHLLGDARITSEEADHEPLTDLATVFFGMGVFTANASLRDKSYHAGGWEHWSISRQGYLTAPILAYALALFAWLRQESRPDWARDLRLDVRLPFRKAMSFLAHNKDSVLHSLEAQDGIASHAIPAGLFPKSTPQPAESSAEDEGPVPTEKDAAGKPDDTAADDQFAQATALMGQGQWNDAIRLLSEILIDDPQDGDAYQQRALAYRELGDSRAALADAEQAVRCSPDDSESYRVRGLACLDAQQCAGAIADFTRYLKEEDNVASNPARVSKVFYARGVAYVKAGDPGRALADFAKAIRRWPQWSAPYEARASIYEERGDTRKAVADREEAARRAATRATGT